MEKLTVRMELMKWAVVSQHTSDLFPFSCESAAPFSHVLPAVMLFSSPRHHVSSLSAPKQCTNTEFRCRNGQCVSSSFVCDDEADCDDGSDEASCPPVTCSATSFQCKNTVCVPRLWLCDGDVDCLDGSDEWAQTCGTKKPASAATHECSSLEYQCGSGECIHSSWKCDGEADCLDRLDEADCSKNDHEGLPHLFISSYHLGLINKFCMLHPSSSSHLPPWWVSVRWRHLHPREPTVQPSVRLQGHEWWTRLRQWYESPLLLFLLWLLALSVSVLPDPMFYVSRAVTHCDGPTRFKCRSGECISMERVCDRQRDCRDWSDEPLRECGEYSG